MNVCRFFVVVALAMGFAGCISAPFQPPMGVVTNYKAPLSTEGSWKQGLKTGAAEAACILGLVATGDCSLNTAIRNGNLKEAYYADYEYFNFLGVYQRVKVIVTGE